VFQEDDLRPLSALQHLVFCERQCALIHLEQVWVENRLTAEGRLLHERADEPGSGRRGDLRTARSLALRSLRLGLVGRADVVEFHRDAGEPPGGSGSIRLPGVSGHWRPFPVEYKRGKPKSHRADEVQLCAQALCLEEMLSVTIPEGALYYGKNRRRQRVALDAELRALTEDTARRLHELLNGGRTPAAVRAPKCRRCSLVEVCLPAAPSASARAYLNKLLEPEDDP
jgi:CRISPR-associated exonuclease Cas4